MQKNKKLKGMLKMMNLGVPQIIWLVLAIMSLGMNLIRHGESKSDIEYNFWMASIAIAIETWILYSGGFFR